MLLALRSLWEASDLSHGAIIKHGGKKRRKPKGQPLFFDWHTPTLNLAKLRQTQEEEELILLAASDL